MNEFIDNPPDVGRIVESLRDTGYEFNTALADIIDNSIAASASKVDVRVALDYGGNVLVAVIDDGCGMDKDGLVNAMRYGAKKRDSPASLGKFGLGLKTASTAFCRRLVVVSRASGDAPALRAVWDIDDLHKAGKWLLELSEPTSDELALLDSVSPNASGTLVFWERVDRLLAEYKKKEGRPIKKVLGRIQSELVDHIAMVYQRYLDHADERARNVVITVNGENVVPWDPFCVEETKEPELSKEMTVELPTGKAGNFTVRAFILPRPEEFSTPENRAKAKVSNDLQGIYVYRENRLIHGPDWMNMYKNEPHLSQLRVELSFNHELDDAFHVDIKKSRILLNPDLHVWLRDTFLAAPRREAAARNRKGAAVAAKGAAALLHNASNNAIEMRVESLSKPTVTEANAQTGVVTVQNNAGSQTMTLHIVVPDSPATVHVTTAASLDAGVLWEPSLSKNKAGVTLNTAHPYYTKAYLPNMENSPLVQALDFLLWSLAQAELNNVSDETSDAFAEFRVEVSRNLKKLVADLPDPPSHDSDE